MSIRIRTKILISFGSVGLVMFLLVAVIFYEKTILFNELTTFEGEMELVKGLADLQLALDRVLMPPNFYLSTGDVGELERFKSLTEETEKALITIEAAAGRSPERTALYRNTVARYGELKRLSQELFAIQDPVGNKKGVMLMRRLDALSQDIIINYLDRLIDFEKEDIKRMTVESTASMRKVDIFILAGVITAVALFLFFTLYLFRSILRPILEFRKGAKKLGEDLDYRIEIRDGVEINLLAKEFNKMGDRLKNLYTDLEKKVDERTRELKGLNAALKQLSITDGLTGLYNHKYFYDKLTEEIRRTERYGRALSLIMIDIDHFKKFNDTNGHPEGDRLLRSFTTCLKENVRAEDVVARYGGEEFAVILPETEKQGATMLAERLKKAVAERDFPHSDTQPGGVLTISLGVATFTEDGDSADTLVKAADDALYRAKEKGRNRVEAAGRTKTSPAIDSGL
ncbi:MAG: hypothetical protein BMS9Abin23_0660 [Thermodesulfobacteriota bacterium]|nr:MAG: hypothetical protein BMS9Abin23_0660 [Thermodesulfobacteriota bacterium]